VPPAGKATEDPVTAH